MTNLEEIGAKLTDVSAQITTAYKDVEKLFDEEKRKRRRLRRKIDGLLALNHTLESNEQNLKQSIKDKDNVISTLKAQVEQQKQQLKSYTSQISVVEAEIASLKSNSRARSYRYNNDTNNRSQHINKPFISCMTWQQRSLLKIGDKIDCRYVVDNYNNNNKCDNR